jgi:hypothetical protein
MHSSSGPSCPNCQDRAFRRWRFSIALVVCPVRSITQVSVLPVVSEMVTSVAPQVVGADRLAGLAALTSSAQPSSGSSAGSASPSR